MKRLFAFALCLFFFVQSEAQNLVANPSFEVQPTCPTWAGQIYYAAGWFQPLRYVGFDITTSSSTELYDSCTTNTTIAVPNNQGGHQLARTGTAYAGFGAGYPTTNNSREYLETGLSSSLIAGETYCVEFYVSLADSSRTATSNLGAYFSNDSLIYDSTSWWCIPVTPQVNNLSTNIITDKNNWVQVSGNFVAQGGERFITIGNFIDSSNGTYMNIPTSGAGAFPVSYYYIDDISVFRCLDTVPVIIEDPNNFYVPNAFSPNDDGNNDFLFVRGRNIDQLSFTVYDRWGQRVFETHNINEGWDGRYNGEQMENAVFVYYLTLTYTDGKTETKKGNISLIR
jgi:gliding motility-associated-like protein